MYLAAGKVVANLSKAMEEALAAYEEKIKETRVKGTKPTLPLLNYTGTYNSVVYGNATVTEEDGKCLREHSNTYACTRCTRSNAYTCTNTNAQTAWLRECFCYRSHISSCLFCAKTARRMRNHEISQD